jgi:membrane associated rhomboid family serine protease
VESNPRKPRRASLRLLPATSLDWLVVGLLTAAATLLLIGIALAASGQEGGDKFSDNLWLAIPMLGAGLSAVIAGAVAAFAVSFRRERSALTFLALVIGLLVLIFMIGEAFGHE